MAQRGKAREREKEKGKKRRKRRRKRRKGKGEGEGEGTGGHGERERGAGPLPCCACVLARVPEPLQAVACRSQSSLSSLSTPTAKRVETPTPGRHQLARRGTRWPSTPDGGGGRRPQGAVHAKALELLVNLLDVKQVLESRFAAGAGATGVDAASSSAGVRGPVYDDEGGAHWDCGAAQVLRPRRRGSRETGCTSAGGGRGREEEELPVDIWEDYLRHPVVDGGFENESEVEFENEEVGVEQEIETEVPDEEPDVELETPAAGEDADAQIDKPAEQEMDDPQENEKDKEDESDEDVEMDEAVGVTAMRLRIDRRDTTTTGRKRGPAEPQPEESSADEVAPVKLAQPEDAQAATLERPRYHYGQCYNFFLLHLLIDADERGSSPSRSAYEGDFIESHLLVDSLVSAKMLAVMENMVKTRVAEKDGDAGKEKEAIKEGSMTSSSTDVPCEGIAPSLSHPLLRDSVALAQSPDSYAVAQLLEEVRNMQKQSQLREQREKEELQAMRELHSAEVDALRRRLSYLETQNRHSDTTHADSSYLPHPQLHPHSPHPHAQGPPRDGDVDTENSWQSRQQRYSSVPYQYPTANGNGHGAQSSASPVEPEPPAKEPPVRIYTDRSFTFRMPGKDRDDEVPLPIKSQRKQYMVFPRAQYG
ncbi:hypothetical protein BJ912DRAFT_1054513 [Pholiota molesta]|nr:hypothetical protein BJ912DRAFT_1054513 [Pholiota molesta]